MKPKWVCLFAFWIAKVVPTMDLNAAPSPHFFELTTTDINGKPFAMSQYQGKVVLVVNTASECGYTKQYNDLEKLYQRFKDKGFVVIGFPSNDFGGQEPGSNEEIKQFCDLKTGKYHISFPMMSKSNVKSAPKNPVYAFLTDRSPLKGEVGWNFEKFLINRDGVVVYRYKSAVTPLDPEITEKIESLLR